MQDSLGRPAFAGRSGSGTAMARIQIGGAGGAPSNNFIRSLRESARHDHIIGTRSEEHTSDLQSLMSISYAVFCLKNKWTDVSVDWYHFPCTKYRILPTIQQYMHATT